MHLVKSRKTQNLSDKRKINGELSNKQDCMSEPNHKHSGLNWQMIWHFLCSNQFKHCIYWENKNETSSYYIVTDINVLYLDSY